MRLSTQAYQVIFRVLGAKRRRDTCVILPKGKALTSADVLAFAHLPPDACIEIQSVLVLVVRGSGWVTPEAAAELDAEAREYRARDIKRGHTR